MTKKSSTTARPLKRRSRSAGLTLMQRGRRYTFDPIVRCFRNTNNVRLTSDSSLVDELRAVLTAIDQAELQPPRLAAREPSVDLNGVFAARSAPLLLPSAVTITAPAYYTQGGELECIDAIAAQLGPDGFIAYLRGTITKYTWRLTLKNTPLDNAQKLQWYATRLVTTLAATSLQNALKGPTGEQRS